MNLELGGVYIVDFKENTDGEINGRRYAIVVSEVAKKDKTFLVIPITGKKKKVKYRGGFTIENNKYFKEPLYERGFAKVRKIREVAISRIKSDLRFTLDEEDLEKLRESLKKVIKVLDK